MAELLAHKAVELDKVKAARRKVLSQPGYLDQHYLAQPKYDGCFGVADLQERKMLTRTNEIIKSCDHVLRDLESCGFGNRVVFGELWKPDMEQSKISGDVRRHTPAPHLNFVVFDCVTSEEFDVGYSAVPYAERMAFVWRTFDSAFRVPAFSAHTCVPVIHYNPGTYGQHEALRDKYLAKGGYDGLILRDQDAPWVMGSGTGGEIIKSKRVLSFDLTVLDVKEGKGKLLGHAGSLVLRWKDGRTIEAIGGSYADRKDWLANPSKIVGRIVEVEAMDYSTDGLLREPRVKSVRFDKERADF
jgi:DNA ligase-1